MSSEITWPPSTWIPPTPPTDIVQQVEDKMLKTVLDQLQQDGVIEVCEGVVRWVSLSLTHDTPRMLQQQWSVMTLQDGKVIDSRKEWRDVPTVE